MARDDNEDDDGVNTSMENIIVVDNLPIVAPEKCEKLLGLLVKLYSKIGGLIQQESYNGVYMPMDEAKNESKGFAFVEFINPDMANAAVDQTNGHKLDHSHTFAVTKFHEMQRILAVKDEYVTPPAPDIKERGNVRKWLLDDKSRDQYAIRYLDESEILWHDPRPDAKDQDRQVFQRKKWTETGHQWSTHGTFITTFHRPGLRLWGGNDFEPIARFMHANVKLAEFSPCERFLVTSTWADKPNDKEDGENAVIIWDVRTGEKKRGFKNEGPKDKPMEPFKWSHDGKYFAKMSEDVIQVYSSEDMKLLDKKALKLPGVLHFQWSPTNNYIAAYIPSDATGQVPARIVLIDMPSRKELRQKNLFSVGEVIMYWHPDGTYLAVKVDRQKSKKTTTYSFELLRIKEKDIPIEVLEVPDQVITFAWEPKGHRFTLVHGEPPRVDVSFYTMLKEGKAQVTLLKTLEKKPVNEVFWSPQGHHVVLAGLKNLNGLMTFYDVDNLESMADDEHFMATDLVWDPTGRYVATYVSAFRQPMENGYQIWNFAGKVQQRTTKDKFWQFIWRPRPPTLLSNKEEREIRKNLPEYSNRYQEEDRKAKHEAETAHLREKQAKREDFEQGEARRRALYANAKALRKQIRGCDTDDESLFEEDQTTFEEVLEIREEAV